MTELARRCRGADQRDAAWCEEGLRSTSSCALPSPDEEARQAAAVHEEDGAAIAEPALREQSAIARERLGGIGRIEKNTLAARRERERRVAFGRRNAVAGADETVVDDQTVVVDAEPEAKSFGGLGGERTRPAGAPRRRGGSR